MSSFSLERTHAPYEWQEEDEFNLLLAIQAISQESVENYNPKINLFDRIEIVLRKRLSYEVILSKIKELRERFYKSTGLVESNIEVERSRVFLISKDIWGHKENNGELGSNRLENGNVEPDDGIKDAERGYSDEVIETNAKEEGAQSGSENETVGVEYREEDGQRNDTTDVEEEVHNSQCINNTDKLSSSDIPDVVTEMEDKEVNKHGNDTMDVEEEVEEEIHNSQCINNTSDIPDVVTEIEDKEVNKHGNEMVEVEEAAKNSQCGIDQKLSRGMPNVTVEMKPKENANLGGVENEMMEHKAKEDFQRDEIMEMEEMEKDAQRSLPVNKKQTAGVEFYECGNFGDTASSYVQKKAVEPPTMKQKTADGTKVGQLGDTTDKAVDLSNESEAISNFGDAASSCVQKEVVENPTKKQGTDDCTTFGQLEAITNKAVELSSKSERVRSKLVPKEHPENKNMIEKSTMSESVSHCHTSDNMIVETSGKIQSETAAESCSTAKPTRSEHVTKEYRANKKFEENTTVSESGSYHRACDDAKAGTSGQLKSETTTKKAVDSSSETKNRRPPLEQRKPSVNELGSNKELTLKKNLEEKPNSLSCNGKQTTEQRNTNEHSPNIPHDLASEQRMKSYNFDSEHKRESLPNNCETVCHQSSHEHKKESSSSSQIETRHCYGQRYNEWRQYSSSRARSPSVPHGHTHANSYQPTLSRKAEDVQRFQSVSHQYSFESLSPRTHSNYTNNLRPNVSHLQRGGYHNHPMAQRLEQQYIQGQRMIERNNLNQNGYNYPYWHSHNGRDVGRHQSYATQRPPLPAEPYPYTPPPPPPPSHHTQPYWHR